MYLLRAQANGKLRWSKKFIMKIGDESEVNGTMDRIIAISF